MTDAIQGTPAYASYDGVVYPRSFKPEVEQNDLTVPDFTGRDYNNLDDVVGSAIVGKDNLYFSTAGNYFVPTIREILPLMSEGLRNAFLATSTPPLFTQVNQNPDNFVQIGNMIIKGLPHLIAGGGGAVDKFIAEGFGSDKRQILADYGSVLLVRKDDRRNKKIKRQGLAAFAKKGLTLTTSNPTEGGSFNRYTKTALGILTAQWGESRGTRLFNQIFADGNWLVNDAPMHRSLANSVKRCEADAGLIFLHLGLYQVRAEPDTFDLIPLGEWIDPNDYSKGQVPLEGNIQGKQFLADTNASLTTQQVAWREELVDLLLNSSQVEDIYRDAGLIPV